MYRLVMGKLPFKGEQDEVIKEQVSVQKLQWTKKYELVVLEPDFIDMVSGFLHKNPTTRLGSTSYRYVIFQICFMKARPHRTAFICSLPYIIT